MLESAYYVIGILVYEIIFLKIVISLCKVLLQVSVFWSKLWLHTGTDPERYNSLPGPVSPPTTNGWEHSGFKETNLSSPLTCKDLILWGASVTER